MESTPEKQKNKGIFGFISSILKMEKILHSEVHSRFFPKALWISFLLILYIWFQYNIDKKLKVIQTLEKEVEYLRTDFISLKTQYTMNVKQSQVAEKVKKLGLEQSHTPPYKIVIKKDEYSF